MRGRNHREHDESEHPGKCPACRQDLPVENGQTWLPVARLADLAEAGFMANLLADNGVPSRIRQYDDFSALDGGWASIYVLQVRDEDARKAVDSIQRELANAPQEPLEQGETTDEATDEATETVEADTAEATPLAWHAVAWVLVAGGIVWAGYGGPGGRVPARRAEERPTLLKAIERIGVPLSSESPPGRPRYRLSFDDVTDQFQLDEDRDGDGRYERRRRYHNRGATTDR